MSVEDYLSEKLARIIAGDEVGIDDKELAKLIIEGTTFTQLLKASELAPYAAKYPYTFLSMVTQIPGFRAVGGISDNLKALERDDTFFYFTGKAKTKDMLMAVASPGFSFSEDIAIEITRKNKLNEKDFTSLSRLIIAYGLQDPDVPLKSFLAFIDEFHPKENLTVNNADSIFRLSCLALSKDIRGKEPKPDYMNHFRLRLSEVLFELYSKGYFEEDVVATLAAIPGIDSTLFADIINAVSPDLNRATIPNKCLIMAAILNEETDTAKKLEKHFDKAMAYLKGMGYEPGAYEQNVLQSVRDRDVESIQVIGQLPRRASMTSSFARAFIKKHGWHLTPDEKNIFDFACLRIDDPVLKILDYKAMGSFIDLTNSQYSRIRDIFEIASKPGLFGLEEKLSIQEVIAGMVKPVKVGLSTAGSYGRYSYDLELLCASFISAGVLPEGTKGNARSIIKALLDSSLFDEDKQSPVIYADNILVTIAENQDEKLLRYAVMAGHDLERPAVIRGRAPARDIKNLPNEGSDRTAYSLRSERYQFESFLEYLLYTNSHIEANIYEKRRRNGVLGPGNVSATQKLLKEALELIGNAEYQLSERECLAASISAFTFNQLQTAGIETPVDKLLPSSDSDSSSDSSEGNTRASALYYLLTNDGYALKEQDNQKWHIQKKIDILKKAISDAVDRSGDHNPIVNIIKQDDGTLKEMRLNSYVPDDIMAMIARKAVQTNHQKTERKKMRI